MDLNLDSNLLMVLDALLEQGSVSGAATVLNRSAPSVSRSLTRIRKLFDDPILVRSGHGLLPTPLAIELRPRVRTLLQEMQDLTQARKPIDMSSVSRIFTIFADDSALCFMASPLLRVLQREAPHVKLSFIVMGAAEASLRSSQFDLEIGILRNIDVETRVELLLEDKIVGVARSDHPLFDHPITVDRFAAAPHLLHSNRGTLWNQIDESLAQLGHKREAAASLPTLAGVLVTISHSDLVSTCLARLSEPLASSLNLRYFDLPVERDSSQISMAWHPRFEMDPAHMWLRSRISAVFRPSNPKLKESPAQDPN